MDAAPTTAYLMLEGDGCAMDCAFCAQARHSHSRSDALSRIIWPEYDSTEVLDRLAQADSLQRICFQVTVHEKALEEVMGLARALRQRSDLPISVAIRPAHIEDLAQLLGAGVDQVGLGLDAACERVYRQIKGPQWSRIMALIEGACRRFPGHIRVHLIVGLDETERELCETMQKIYDWGGAVGLFAFTPVRGTRLQDRPQPPLDVYRRMQTARYLMQHKLARSEGFRYDRQGRLLDLGRPDWATLLADGEAFRTSGCPGCNRPFYNERPGGTMYNYPRPLRGQEAAQALQDMWAGLKEEC
ncbi:MAG: radical SAM protein [Chloroflexia bacterium]|nr:radical SAM protein [Chloroflexia bacterium]